MRIYCPNLLPTGVISLPHDEATHAIKVMRLRVGDVVELFDGAGAFAIAKIVEAEKNRCVVGIERFTAAKLGGKSTLVVGVGLPKGDRQRSVIERATELGVDEIVPLDCEFGVAVATDNAIERAKRTVIESCKQSGRNHLMQIGEPQRSDSWFAEKSMDESHRVLRLICHLGVEDSVGFADLVKRQLAMCMQTISNPSPPAPLPEHGARGANGEVAPLPEDGEKGANGEVAPLPEHGARGANGEVALLSEVAGKNADGQIAPFTEDGVRGAEEHRKATGTQPVCIQLAIGPEGGFSDRELAIAIQNNWQVLDLGELILRVETALTTAVAVAKLVMDLHQSSAPGSRSN